MKKLIFGAIMLLSCTALGAKDKKEITKTGYNFGPLPNH